MDCALEVADTKVAESLQFKVLNLVPIANSGKTVL